MRKHFFSTEGHSKHLNTRCAKTVQLRSISTGVLISP